MIDKISIQRINLLHPKLREEVLKLVEDANTALKGRSQVRIVQGYRTFDEQAKLYAQGRTSKGPVVTNAKAGQSYHNYGVAIDFCLLIDGKEISWNVGKDWDGDGIADWIEVVQVFTKAGWKWGKAFNDLPHLEKNFNIDWRVMLKRHDLKQFIPGTTYIQI